MTSDGYSDLPGEMMSTRNGTCVDKQKYLNIYTHNTFFLFFSNFFKRHGSLSKIDETILLSW